MNEFASCYSCLSVINVVGRCDVLSRGYRSCGSCLGLLMAEMECMTCVNMTAVSEFAAVLSGTCLGGKCKTILGTVLRIPVQFCLLDQIPWSRPGSSYFKKLKFTLIQCCGSRPFWYGSGSCISLRYRSGSNFDPDLTSVAETVYWSFGSGSN